MYAFDPNSGDVKWRFQTGEGLTSGPEIIVAKRGEEWSAALSGLDRLKKRGKKEVSATPVVQDGAVYVGDDAVSSTSGCELSPGDALNLRFEETIDLRRFYVDAANNNDKVDYMGVSA